MGGDMEGISNDSYVLQPETVNCLPGEHYEHVGERSQRVGNFENVAFVAKDWSYHGRFKDPLVRVPGFGF